MQASAVKQKLEGASIFLSKLRWSQEIKYILINGNFKKPSFQWDCCTVASFCDQIYILHWMSQLVFFLMIKTILTKVPHVHALIFKTPVVSAKIKVVSMSGFYAPHDWWLFEDGWVNLTHSPHSPWRSYMALFTGMLEHATSFPVMSTPSSCSSRETTLRCSVCPGPPLPSSLMQEALVLHLCVLRAEQRSLPALCPLFFTWSLLLSGRLSRFGSNPYFVAPAGKHRAQMKSVMQLVVSAAASYHVLASRYRWGSQECVCIEAHMLPLSPFYCPPRPVRSEVGSRGASRV